MDASDIQTMQAGVERMVEDHYQTFCSKQGFPSFRTVTVTKSTEQLTAGLICAPARDAQLPQVDVMGTVVDHLFAKWGANGTYMELLASANGTVRLPTIQSSQGSQVIKRG